MNLKVFKQKDLYINYLGPISAIIGSFIATPILITNLNLETWSLFALINLFLPINYLILYGNNNLIKRKMINIFLNNKKKLISSSLFFHLEKKIFIKFSIFSLLLFVILKIFNSNSYQDLDNLDLSFFFVSLAIVIKIFEIYYAEALSGLKLHFQMNFSLFLITLLKWLSIIYLSYLNNIDINLIILIVIFFSLILLLIQRRLIKRFFKSKNIKDNDHSKYFNQFKNTSFSFGSAITLLFIIQQFDKVLLFGFLDSRLIAFYSIASILIGLISSAISPILSYLAPEIYELSENKKKDRWKIYLRLLLIHFLILSSIILLFNFNFELILSFWLQDILSRNALTFFHPLSIALLAISITETVKTIYIAENSFNNLLLSFYLLLIYQFIQFFMLIFDLINFEIYLYSWSFSLIFFLFYLTYKLFTKILRRA